MADEVVIERLGAQGDGVAEAGALFVPYVLPGERVAVYRFGPRGQAARVLERAEARVTPACLHFGQCGGCALQHGADGFVAAWKTERVVASLAQRGIEAVEIRPIETSPPASRRRITLTARRLKKSVVIGFHVHGSDAIVGIEDCPVARPRLVAVIPALEELVVAAASRKGEVRIILTDSQGGVDCAITDAKPVDGPARALLAGAVNRAGLARLAWNGEVVLTRTEPVQHFGQADVVIPPGGFLQATAEGEAVLVARVREILEGAKSVADLFSGAGTFALPLAETAEVHAVEADRAALTVLDQGWRGTAGALKRVTSERRDLFAHPLRAGGHGGGELKVYDGVVLDPPRAGAAAQARELAASNLPRIAYVSCNPATFARDARTLIDGGYALDWVQPVDQFRWSPHIELVGAFRKGG